jgi:Domain of Unknown Function (DUF1259)
MNAKSKHRTTGITTASSEMRSDNKSTLFEFGALVVLTVLLFVTVLLTTMADNSFAQGNNKTTVGSHPSNTNPTIASASAAAGNNNKLNCQSIAAKIAGIVVPNPSKICDVLILRQSPTIIGPGNMNMNKFSTINSIVEVASMSDLMTNPASNATTGSSSSSSSSSSQTTKATSTANNSSSQKVFVMGEFALLEQQLIPMVKAAATSNWTIAAVHNHMVQEKPKMIFVHWSAQGDLNTITNQIRSVLLTVSKVSNAGSS